MRLTKYIDDEEALDRLEAAISRAGSATIYAKRMGVSSACISAFRRARKDRRQPITGKVAADLGLKRVSVYQLTLASTSPEQERYENERRKWNDLNDIKCEQSRTMRVAGDIAMGRKFPDRPVEEEKE